VSTSSGRWEAIRPDAVYLIRARVRGSMEGSAGEEGGMDACRDAAGRFTRRSHLKSDLTGQRFGRLVVVRYAGRYTHGRRGATGRLWKLRCACGEMTFASTNLLRNGDKKSCGCGTEAREEALRKRNFRHGYSHLRRGSIYRTYMSWKAMRTRCTNPRQGLWHRYGGAGVRVCKRWNSFTTFLADLGPRRVGTTLGRFKDSGDYRVGNAKWMTQKQQTAERWRKKHVG
jgi:hypothetical protein